MRFGVRLSLWLGSALLAVAAPAQAEGSRTLYPASPVDYFSQGTTAPNPAGPAQRAGLLTTAGSYLGGVVSQRTFFYVYARAGETILIGRSGTTTDFSLYAPPAGQALPGNLGFGTRGAEALGSLTPLSSATICAAGGGTGSPVVGAADGLPAATSIGTNSQANGNPGQPGRNNEIAGPFAGAPGFVPCRYRVTTDGVYGVVFSGTTWMWELSVRETAGLTTNPSLNGRVFTYAFSGTSGTATNAIYSTLYYVTSDGYRYSQAMRGLAPFQYVLYANDRGFTDQGEPLYRNVRGQGQTLGTLRFDEAPNGGPAGSFADPANTGQIVAQGAQYPIFFSDVMAVSAQNRVNETLTVLGIPTTPPPPVISGIEFFYPPTGGGTSYVGYGGVFRFNAQDVTSYRIFIKGADPADPDYDSLDNPLNRVIEGTAGPGLNQVVWDGLNAAGVPIPAGSGYSFEVTGRNGEVHFPFLDAEANLAGGPTLTKLNGPNAGDTTVYYDDRGYLTRAGYRVGNIVAGVPGHLCGNTAQANNWPQPQPNQALEGVDSAAFNAVTGQYYRFWGQGTTGNTGNDCPDSNAYFGDAKGMDLWAYETSESPLDLSFDIVDIADVTAAVQGPAFAAPGATVVNLISFANVGSRTANDVVYSATLPPGLTGVVCGGATCAYDPVTGIVSITGLPTTLTPSQFLPTVSLSYIAPASGAPRIDVFISSPSESPAPGIAPNTGFAITTIDATADVVDVLAQVNPPGFAAPGSIVDVPVVFRNLGPASAENVAYELELPPGLDPADVSCQPNPPVTCSYNPVTGAITVSGLPATLAAGGQVGLTLSYRAPAAPGAVQVTARVSTTSDEAGSTANNTASGQTVVTATVAADVTVSVSVPASAAEGDVVNGQVLFENRGPSTATITQYSVELPLGLTGVACTPAVDCSIVTTATAIVISWTGPATLPNGGTYPAAFSYLAPPGPSTVGVLASIATSTAGDEPSNNFAQASTTILQLAADMRADFGPVPSVVSPGQVLSGLTLTCTNDGPGSAVNPTCLPSAGLGAISNLVCTPDSPALLASGGAIICTFDFTAPGVPGGSNAPDGPVTFTGATNADNDGNPANNLVTTVAAIIDALDDAISRPAGALGQTFNVGGNDEFPIGSSFSLLPGGTCANPSINPSTGVATFDVSPSPTCTLIYQVCAPAPNQAVCDSATLVVDSAEVALSLTKTASPASFTVGVPASYTLTVQNDGNVATTAAATVTDVVPASLTLGALPAGCSAAGQTVTCTIAAGLAVGGSVSFVIPVTPTAAAQPSVENTATVVGGGDPGCPGLPRCGSTITTPVDAPALTITKTATPASFTVGVAASYTLAVQNTGTAATTEAATVTDVVSASLTIGTLPAGCSAAGQTVTCTIAAGLAVGGSVSFVIPVTPTAAAQPSVENTATIVGGGDPGCPGLPRCGSTITTPVDAPALTITKTATPASFTVGVAASYTLAVQNTGTAATTEAATVTDVVSASLTIGTLPAGCSAAGQTVTCTIAAGLAVGGSVSFVIPVTPTAAAQPSVENTATIVGGGDPGCPGLPRCGSTITTPVDAPALTITKTATPSSFTVGVAASYTLSVQNTGSAATTEAATVTDVVPASLTLGALPAGCSAAGQTVTCTIAAGLAVGGSVSFVIPVTPTAAAQPSVENTATVEGGGDPGCPAAARCGSTITTPVNAPALTITKTAAPSSFTVGVAASYTLSVQNTGSAATTEAATVTDVVPASLTLGALPAGCSATGQTVTCTIAAGLAVNDSVSFVIPVTPTAAALPSVVNTATVVGGGDPGCPGLPRCGSTISTPVQGPNVSLAKTANPASGSLVVVGNVITYTLQVQVSDAALIAPFELSDVLGAGLLRGPVMAGSFSCGVGEPLVCSLPAGTPVGSYAVTYTATVQPDAVGSVGNVVTVTGNGGDVDPVCSPCSTTHPLSVADLEVIKTVDQATPAIGSEIVFSLQVRNLGPDPATNVRVLDALPAGFSLVSTTASQGAYAAPLWTVGSLAVGQTETLQMRVQVNGSGPYLNVADAEADQFDPVPDNNTDGVEPLPPAPPPLQRPAVIPVDHPLALLLLVLAMGVIAARRMPRA